MDRAEQIYREHYEIPSGPIPSNVGGNQSVGVFLIIPLKYYETDKDLRIENLVALTKKEAEQYLHRPMYFWTLFSVIRSDLKALGKSYDDSYIWKRMQRHAYDNDNKKIKSL